MKVTTGGRTQIDEVMSGSSYYSQSDFRLHFGLGARGQGGRVELAWPSGVKETFKDLPANHLFVVQEAQGHRQQPEAPGSYEHARRLEPLSRRRRSRCCVPRSPAWLPPAPRCSSPTSRRPLGIDFKHENSATSNKYLIETMGGGVALLDYDNDGRLDIFFTNGAKLDDPMPEGKLPDKSDREVLEPPLPPEADGTFTDVTEKAGLTGMPQNQYGMGVAVGDYDNDGFADLYVTGYGGNTLYRNNGDGTFTDVTARGRRRPPADGAPARGSSTTTTTASSICSSPATWNGAFENNRYCGEKKPGYRAYCHPDNFEAIDATSSTTTTATARSRTSPRRPASPTADGKGLGVAFADYDGDGFTDVYVANDSVQSFLFHNNGDGTFDGGGPARGRRVQRGRQDLRRDGRRLRGLRQRRPSRHRRHGSLQRALQAVPPERRRQLPGRDATRRASAAPPCRSPVGARGSSTTTTTAGRTSSSPRDT